MARISQTQYTITIQKASLKIAKILFYIGFILFISLVIIIGFIMPIVTIIFCSYLVALIIFQKVSMIHFMASLLIYFFISIFKMLLKKFKNVSTPTVIKFGSSVKYTLYLAINSTPIKSIYFGFYILILFLNLLTIEGYMNILSDSLKTFLSANQSTIVIIIAIDRLISAIEKEKKEKSETKVYNIFQQMRLLLGYANDLFKSKEQKQDNIEVG